MGLTPSQGSWLFEWSTDPVPTGIKVPYPIAFQLDSNTEGMSFHICARVQEYDYHDQSPKGMAGWSVA